MTFKIASVDSLIIYFGNEISEDISLNVRKAYESLKNLNLEGLIEIIPSYSSLFITYDIFIYDYETITKELKELINLDYVSQKEEKVVKIDVYYGSEVAFDLANLSKKTNLSIKEVISLHSSKLYDVYAIGFLPGFAYLGSVDKKIAMPRLDSPRKVIPKGSVAIADTQTAVYPQNSPGGWNIIGRTVMELVNKDLASLCPFEVGYKVKFNSISKEEFIKQGGVL